MFWNPILEAVAKISARVTRPADTGGDHSTLGRSSSQGLAMSLATLILALAGCDSAPMTPDARVDAGELASNTSATTLSSTGLTETTDVFGQGLSGPVVAEDGATIVRTPNGIAVSLSMPTPEPGAYTYPSGPPGGAWTDEEGPPEAFTLWTFVFNHPEECETPFQCGPGDIGPPAGGGAFFAAGHVFGGPHLTLSGQVSKNSEPVAGSPIDLEQVKEAHVHLAVAPHGAMDPELMPTQIQTPTGPGPDIWWLALFVE